jgi:predicted DNA binding CopG/RHH family protein
MSIKIESKEELEILQDVENGKYKSVDTKEFTEIEDSLKKAATNTIEKLSKRKAINIRLLESDIERLKAMALNEGMPYQTYITHMIHKLTTGRLKAV